MKIIPLKDIAGMEDGMPLPAINALIEKVFDVREGTGKNKKPYKFQDVILKDGDLEVKMTLNNCETTISSKKEGEKIVINCASGKHGLTGVKVKWDDYIPDDAPEGYKGRNIIWVTDSAEIAYEGAGEGGGSSESAPSSSKSSDAGSKKTTSAPAADTPVAPASKAEAIAQVKKLAARASSIMAIAIEASEHAAAVVEKSKGIKIPAESKAAHASTIFIEICHHGAMKIMPVVNLLTFDPANEANEAKAKAEAAEKAKKEAEEKAKREEEERKKGEAARAERERKAKAKEALDEDVPF